MIRKVVIPLRSDSKLVKERLLEARLRPGETSTRMDQLEDETTLPSDRSAYVFLQVESNSYVFEKLLKPGETIIVIWAHDLAVGEGGMRGGGIEVGDSCCSERREVCAHDFGLDFPRGTRYRSRV